MIEVMDVVDQTKSPRILIVDDMPAMRKLIVEMLEFGGFFKMREAEDGEIAWKLIQEEAFDLIIADWNMPGLSGMELLRSVRTHQKTKSIPFLMVTGRCEQAHIDEALYAGVSDYIVKPFDAGSLVQKISEIRLGSHEIK